MSVNRYSITLPGRRPTMFSVVAPIPAPTSRIRTGRSPRDETIPTTASATAALIALLILFCP